MDSCTGVFLAVCIQGALRQNARQTLSLHDQVACSEQVGSSSKHSASRDHNLDGCALVRARVDACDGLQVAAALLEGT
jgi:hypothetical protein